MGAIGRGVHADARHVSAGGAFPLEVLPVPVAVITRSPGVAVPEHDLRTIGLVETTADAAANAMKPVVDALARPRNELIVAALFKPTIGGWVCSVDTTLTRLPFCWRAATRLRKSPSPEKITT